MTKTQQALDGCPIEKYKESLEHYRAEKRSWGPKPKNVPPTETPKLSHAELVSLAAKFLRYDQNCGIVVEELRSWSGVYPDAMGWQSGASFMVEAKASRSDFFADRKKHHHGTRYAVQQWYIVPWGLITPDEVPEGYGLLYAGGNSLGHIHEIIRPVWVQEGVSDSLHCSIFYSLLRRHKIAGIQKDFEIEPDTRTAAHSDISIITKSKRAMTYDFALALTEFISRLEEGRANPPLKGDDDEVILEPETVSAIIRALEMASDPAAENKVLIIWQEWDAANRTVLSRAADPNYACVQWQPGSTLLKHGEEVLIILKPGLMGSGEVLKASSWSDHLIICDFNDLYSSDFTAEDVLWWTPLPTMPINQSRKTNDRGIIALPVLWNKEC